MGKSMAMSTVINRDISNVFVNIHLISADCSFDN